MNEICGAEVPELFVIDRLGAGMIPYTERREALYTASKMAALNDTAKPAVELLNSTSNFPLRGQHDSPWMFYKNDELYLTHAEFRVALCIRLRVLPKDTTLYIGTPRMCRCGELCTTQPELIEHAMACHKFSDVSPTMRHTMVVDALCDVARRHGITVSKEPRCFTYSSEAIRRPDIIFHTPKRIVTDVTIVGQGIEVGVEASRAADEKNKIHKAAVEKANMLFYPFAMEQYGHMDKAANSMLEAIASQLPRHFHYSFVRDARHAVGTALAKARVLTLMSALGRADVLLR